MTAAAIGVDPKTGERVVLQPMGRVQHDVSLGQLVKLFDEKATRNKNAQVLATDQAGIAALRSFDDKDLDARGLRDPKNLEYVTLSGDKSSEKGFTYPTRWVKDSGDLFSRRLVVDGPFRGVFLDDLASHLDEKSAADAAKDSRLHWLSPTKAGIAPLITTVTVDKGGEKKSMLRLRVPSSPEWTAVRQSLRALSDKLDGVSLVKDSKNTLFVFDAGNHGFIRKTAQFFGITAEAQSLVQQHVDELTKFEKALTPDAIAQYKAAKIGGFKTSITGRDGKSARFELSEIQQRSIARLVMDDYSGSLTLGMGMGKTLVALAAMQLLKKDGEKRPFLIVVPEGLEGGFHAEIHSKLEPTAAKALADQLVVMDHKTFRKAMRTGQHDGKKFDASKFGAAIYDEAHMLSDRKTASGKAMLSFAHPRTILMSGTPQPQPDKLQTMDAAAQGVNLNAPEARQLRKQARDWRKLLFNEVNGIAVSVKGPFELKRGLQIDPTRELLEWIRTRFIYADNFDDNVVLPKRTDMHVTLNMPKELEASYRSKSRPAATALQGLVSIYRDLGVAVRDDGAPVLKTDRYGNKKPIMTRQAKSDRVHDIKTELKPIIGELSAMTNTPDKTRLAGKKLLELMAEDEARGVPPSRALLFTDDKNYVKSAAQTLSQQQPSKLHVAALGDAIHVFRNGKELTELGPFKLPFSQQAYRADPNKPASASNPEVPAEAWRTFVLNEVVGKHKEVATSTLFGPVYQAGQNLQWANAVVHLDRDTWSDFNMRQREHRAHRRGQTRPVTVMHLDYVFNKPKTNLDRTLDEVRGLQAQNDRRLLAGTLQAAQKITLGEDFDAARLDDAFDHNERAGLKDLALLAAGVEPSGESIGLAGT